MLDKIMIAIIGIMCGVVIQSVAYDIKLANMDIHFANQLGTIIPGEIKLLTGLVMLIVLALFVFIKKEG